MTKLAAHAGCLRWSTRTVGHRSSQGALRLGPAVSGDYSIGLVNEDRIDESEFCDARRDLPDLPSSMRPRILCPRLELAGSL